MSDLKPLNLDLSKLDLDVTMLRLHFTNWSNIDFANEPNKFLERTTVWTDFQTGSDWRSETSNLTDLGFANIGALLTELDLSPSEAFDNLLNIIVPNANEGGLGIISKQTAEYALTNYDESGINLRTRDDEVIGFEIEGTKSNDNLKTNLGSDRVKSSLGDDIIDLGQNGDTGNWWSDIDTVEFSGSLNVLNRATGAFVQGYEVSQNEDGSMTVTDILGEVANDEGANTLYGVEELQFGDGEWMQLAVRESISSWGGGDWRERRLNVDGGAFDDVIIGTIFNDDIRGKEGDDIIIADGSFTSFGSLNISGGDAGDIARDIFGGSSEYDGFKNINPKQLSGMSKAFDGIQQRVNVYDNNTGEYRTADTIVAGDLYFHSNAAASEYDLTSISTESELATLVAKLRNLGEDINAEVFVRESESDTYFLLDVEVDETFRSGDWIEGGKGNDFIDGGVQGSSVENAWENWNKSYYEAHSSNFEVKQITYATDATTFNDGTLVLDFAKQFSLETDTLGDLINLLGFSVSNTTLTSGETITFVGDTVGDLGLDVVKNIQRVGFSDTWINLNVTVQANNWSQQGGYDIEGTIFSDIVMAGQNGLTTDHFADARTWINTQGGNDIVVSGNVSDQINTGSGYDFVDAGLNTTGNDRWQKADEVRFDGAVERFDVEQITYTEAKEYLNTEGRFSIGNLSVVDLLGADTSKTFFKVSDKAGSFGLGETVVTGVERLSFKGENLWTAASYNEWLNFEISNNHDNVEIKALRQDLNLEGSKFSDLVKLSEITLLQTDSDWADALLSNNRVTTLDEANEKIKEYSERLHEFNVRLGDGDDVLYADTGHGTSVRLGAGNDIAIASPTTFKREDGAFDYASDTEIRFDGKIDRYTITEISGAGYVLNDGTFVTAGLTGHETNDILFDLTDLNIGEIKNGSGRVVAQSSEISDNQGLLIIDRLPTKFGGQGVDLIFGFERIDFEDSNFQLETEVEIRKVDWLRDGAVQAIDVRMKDSGGYFNALEEIGKLNQVNDNTVTDMKFIEGSANDDFIVGSNLFNEMELGSGDDIFVTLSSSGENFGINSNPWDYYDKARFSGSISRYEIDQIYIKVVKNPSDQIVGVEKDDSNQIKFYEAVDAENGIYSGVKVVDKLGSKGDGIDILIGIDVLDFSDERLEISQRFDVDLDDRDYRGSFKTKFGVDEYTAPVFRQEGTIFADTLIGAKPVDEDAAFYLEWDFVELDSTIVQAFIKSGAVSDIPVLRDWSSDGLSTPVGLMSKVYSDPYSDADITDDLTSWVGRIYFNPPDGSDASIVKKQIETEAALLLDVLNNTNSSAEEEQLGQSEMVGRLANLFYESQVTNLITLSHAFGAENDGDFSSISFPMLDKNNKAYMAAAYSDGEDRLIGGDGNDLLIGNGGIGKFEPGRGDDIIFGSTNQYEVNMDPYADDWNRDRVKYNAESSRFELKEVYGYVDFTNHEIIGGVGSLVESIDQLESAPSGAKVSKILVVKDNIDIEDLNLGTDYLINVDQIEFQADSQYVRSIPIIEYQENNWIPNVSNSILDGAKISSFEVYDTTRFSDEIDFNSLWIDQNLVPYLLPSIDVTWSRENEEIEGYSYRGFNTVELGPGSDIFVGIEGSEFVDHVNVQTGSFTDYLITRKTDKLGASYVEVKLSESSSVLDEELGVTNLYDFESVWFNQERKNVYLDTFANPNRFYDRGRMDFETSIFDDELNKSDFDALKPSGFDQLTWFNIKDSIGNDKVSLDWGFAGFYLSYGDDEFDGGDGADYTWTPNSASNYEVSFIKKVLVDGELSEVALTHEQFLESGIASYHTNTDLTGKLNSIAPIDDSITREQFEARFTSELFNNINWGQPLLTGEPDFHNESLGGPGWVEYNDGFFVKIKDKSANNLHGTDYFSNVEAFWFGDYIYDPIQNNFFDVSGKSGDDPYLSYAYSKVTDEEETAVLNAMDSGDVTGIAENLKAVYQYEAVVSEYDDDWEVQLSAKSELLNLLIDPAKNGQTITAPFEHNNRVDLLSLILGAKVAGGKGFDELYGSYISESVDANNQPIILLTLTGSLDDKNMVIRIPLTDDSNSFSGIADATQFEPILKHYRDNILLSVVTPGFTIGEKFDLNATYYADRWVREAQEVLARDTNSYFEITDILDPNPINPIFGSEYDLSTFNPDVTRAVADQILTDGYQWVNFSDGTSDIITWNSFRDNSASNVVLGTNGSVRGTLTSDLAGTGTGHASAMLASLLDREILEETDTVGDETIAAVTGQNYKVNWTAGIEAFKASTLGKFTLSLLADQEVRIAVRDEFEDGFGDDVYRGGSDFYGFDNDIISDDNWATSDTVRIASDSENFDISIGYLNDVGKITGLSSSHPLYGKVVGSASESFVKVTDLSTTDASGFGTNYLFDVEMVRFSDTTKWIGSTLRYSDQDEKPNQIRLDSYSSAPELFDAQTNKTLSSGFNKADVSSGDYGAIRFELNQTTLAKKYFFGLEQLDADVAGDNWDYDQVRINDNSWNFDVTPTLFIRNADKTLVMKSLNAVEEFSGSEVLSEGQKFVDGFVISDNRNEEAKKYGDIYISDIEVISFSDNGYSLVKEFEVKTGNYDLWLGDNVEQVPTFTWNEYRINSQFGGLDYTFDGFGDTSQSEVDKIKTINISSNGMSNDSIVIDTSNYKTYINLNGGDDYVYLGSGLNLDGSPDYSGSSSVAIDDFASRFAISRVWTLLDENTLKPFLTNTNNPASWVIFNEARIGATEAILIKDTLNDGFGRKLVIGVGSVDFEDQYLNLSFNIRKEDWDNDGAIDRYRFEGTDFDDLIIYLDENSDGSIEDEMSGGKGNDTLVGGAGGDRLDGGQGNDVIFGGANGSNGDWHDNDRLTYYNKNFADLEITKATVGVNYTTYEVLRNASGEILRNVEDVALPEGYSAVLGTFVKDLIGSGGTDLLLDVEILETKNRGVELNAYSRTSDWNGDGYIDWANVEGTEFNDLINTEAFGEEFMRLDNDFNVRAGDDVVFGELGGDNARLGAGNDVFIGGENGEIDKWGWQQKDEARFDNSYIRYDIESMIWSSSNGSKQIKNTDGDLIFSVNSAGEIFRFDEGVNDSQSIVQVAKVLDGERLTIVTDLVPEIDGIESDGVNLLVGVEYLSFSDKWMTLDVEYHYDRDEFGNIQGSWVNATEFSETLTGTDGRDHFNDGAGDDIVIGGLGGDHFNIDRGNDTVYGDALEGSLDDGEHDSVRFDGDFEQFKLIVKFEESGRRFIEVTDLLPGEFGLGTNKLYDIENISFSNKWMNVGVRYDYFENWDGSKGSHINGSEFDDDIQGTVDGDSINGGIGNDILRGGDGADYFDGGSGNDTVYGGEEGLNPWGHKDVDIFRLSGSKTDYTVTHFQSSGLESLIYREDGYMEVSKTTGSITETDTLYGIERIQFDGSEMNFVSANGFENGKWVWKGTDSKDTPDGSSRDERIYGNAGDDKLSGGLGSDDLIGGAGDDVLYGNNSNGDSDVDDIGIPFIDTAVFADKYSDTTITSLGTSKFTIETLTEGTDTLHDIEIIEFSDRTERLVAETLGRDRDRDGVVDLEIVYGTFGNDNFETIVDTSKATVIYGGAGADTLSFNSAHALRVHDDLGVNSYIASGSSQNDILVVNDVEANWGLTENLSLSGIQYEYKIENGTTNSASYVSGFERITFENSVLNLKKTEESVDIDDDGIIDLTFVLGADVSETNSALNYSTHLNSVDINGNAGDDIIVGSAFDDLIKGGTGDDIITGGLGSDVFILDVKKEDAIVSEVSNTFTVEQKLTGEVDTLSEIEAIQFSDSKERLTIIEEDIREYVYGQGFVTTQKIVGNNFDNSFSAGDKDKIITTGEGADTITVDVTDDHTLIVSDFDADHDSFIFSSDTTLSVRSFSAFASAGSELVMSSGATVSTDDGSGIQKFTAKSIDYFVFDDEIFSGTEDIAASDLTSTRIVISAPNSEEIWLQENMSTTSTHTILNIGTGKVQIDDVVGSETLRDILELI